MHVEADTHEGSWYALLTNAEFEANHPPQRRWAHRRASEVKIIDLESPSLLRGGRIRSLFDLVAHHHA